MSIEYTDLANANGKDVFIESVAHPGHFLTAYGQGGDFEKTCACFRAPAAGENMSAFRVKLYVVGTAVHLAFNGLGLRHHGWTGKFFNPALNFYVGAGLMPGAGIVNINQGTNPWKQVEYFTVEANRAYGAVVIPLSLVMAYRTAPPADDAGKSARSFRIHLADSWIGTPKGGDKVSFRNVATGQYITLWSAPQGGGTLVCGDTPMLWRLYQAAGAEPTNFEVKRDDVQGFNWSNYDNADDNKAFIAWNHAKRLPNATTPDAPHAWYFDDQGDGSWLLRWGDQVAEVMPGMYINGDPKLGERVITRAAEPGNLRQHWVIEH